MPYIKNINCRREELGRYAVAETPAELNFQIFKSVLDALPTAAIDNLRILKYVQNFIGDTPNYQKYNDMAGCLILCYREIKRRLNFDYDFLLTIIDMYNVEIANYENSLKMKIVGVLLTIVNVIIFWR